MIFIYSFLIGGLICGLAQLIYDKFKLSYGDITSLFVSLGALLEFFNIYDKIVDFSGAGALLPITSFGHSLAHAAYNRALDDGFIGLFTGMFDKTSAGITLVIILSLISSLIFKPKS